MEERKGIRRYFCRNENASAPVRLTHFEKPKIGRGRGH